MKTREEIFQIIEDAYNWSMCRNCEEPFQIFCDDEGNYRVYYEHYDDLRPISTLGYQPDILFTMSDLSLAHVTLQEIRALNLGRQRVYIE